MRWGWLGTLRNATGIRAWTVRASRWVSAIAIAAASGASVVSTPVRWRSLLDHPERNAVLTRPATKSGSVRIATSWSRLVTRPWMRVRRSTPASWRHACSRVGACTITLASIAS